MNSSLITCTKPTRLASALAIAALGLVATSAWSQTSTYTSNGCTLTYDPALQAFVPDSSCSSSGKNAAIAAFLQANPITPVLIQGQITTLSYMVNGRNRGAPSSARASLPGQTGLAGAAGDSPWSGWAALSSNNVGFNFAPLSSSGNAVNALVGADYLFTGGAVAGVALGSDSSKTNTNFNNGNVNTSGYTLSPYFLVPLGTNWTLDGSLGFGSGKISTNIGGGVSGNTTDTRTFGALALTYATTLGSWQVQSTGSLLSSSSKVNQFTMSNGAVIANSTSGVTQLRAGARGYYGSGQFVPFLGLTYSQDLARTDVQPIAGQTAANARGAIIALAGIGINQGKQISGSVQLTSEMRNQVRNNGVLGSLSLKF